MYFPTITMETAVKTQLTLCASLLGLGAVTISGEYYVGFILKTGDERRYLVTLVDGKTEAEATICTIDLAGLIVESIPPPPSLELTVIPDPRQTALNLEAATQTDSEPEGEKPAREWTPTNPPPVDSHLL